MVQRLEAIFRGVVDTLAGRHGLSLIVCLAALALVQVACGAPRRQPPSSPPVLPSGANLVSASFVDPMRGWVVAADCGEDATTPSSACRALLYATSDGGRSWRPGARVLVTPRKLQFTDQSTGWLIGSIGRECGESICPNVVMRTSDGGRTWERASTVSIDLVDLSFTSPRDGWVLGQECSAPLACTAILVSTQSAGASWTNQELPLTGRGFRLARLSAKTGWIGGIIGGRATLLATRDAGGHWDRIETPCQGDALAFAFPSALRGWLYCATASGANSIADTVYRTDDGGRTWQATGHQPGTSTPAASGSTEPTIIVPSPGDTWVLDRRGRVLVSRDGGATWSQPRTLDAPVATLFFVDATHGWAAGGQMIWRTDDAGRSWERVSGPS